MALTLIATPDTEEPTEGTFMDNNEMRTETVLVTPEVAERWLEGSTNYRKPGAATVRRYADDMINGRWDFTEASIALDPEGNVADGQHRLRAVILTGIPRKFRVTYNCPTSAVRDMNSGRNAATEIAHLGYDNPNRLVAVAATILLFADGNLHDSSARATPAAVRDFVVDNWSAVDLAQRRGRVVRGAIGVNPTSYAAFFYHAATLDLDDAERFTQLLVSGAGLTIDDPVLALRNWVINRRAKGTKVTSEEWCYAFTKSWSAWRKNVPMKLMKVSIKGRGEFRTPFPELV